MTQSIRDAAQAVLDAGDMIGTVGVQDRAEAMRTAVARLRTALSAPQPTADERVADHMRCVDDFARASTGQFAQSAKATRETIEASARALLSASQEDAEHAAMYRWLRDGGLSSLPYDDHGAGPEFASGEDLDAVIRAAMNAKETK